MSALPPFGAQYTNICPDSIPDKVPHFFIHDMILVGDSQKSSEASHFCSLYLFSSAVDLALCITKSFKFFFLLHGHPQAESPTEEECGQNGPVYGETSLAAQLIQRGASPDAVEPESGNSLLHMAARNGYQTAAIFLAQQGASVGHSNFKVWLGRAREIRN